MAIGRECLIQELLKLPPLPCHALCHFHFPHLCNPSMRSTGFYLLLACNTQIILLMPRHDELLCYCLLFCSATGDSYELGPSHSFESISSEASSSAVLPSFKSSYGGGSTMLSCGAVQLSAKAQKLPPICGKGGEGRTEARVSRSRSPVRQSTVSSTIF